MKKFRFLRYIYGIALLLSLIGYWLDSDIPENAAVFQMLEVFLVSVFLFIVFTVIYLLFFSLWVSIKGLLNK